MKRLIPLLPPLLLAFLSGVFIASLLTPPLWFSVFLALGAVVLLALYVFTRKSRLPLLIFIFLGLLIGVERYALWESKENNATLERSVGEMVVLEGIVTDEPDIREGKNHLTVTFENIKAGSTSLAVFGTARVIVNRFPLYNYGDRLLLEGKLALPQILTEDDGRVFDYPAYLRSKGIRYQMLFPRVSILEEHQGSIVMEKLFSVKSSFEEGIANALPAPQSALLSGLLLGGKQSLGAVWLERFRTSGIVHIVVLSGYNMTVVAEWLVVLFRSFGFYGSLSVGAVGIVLFALMTGAGATVMRAAIMALIVLLAKATGRNYDMGRALLLAATLMVLQNPSILLFDPSFQLSFLASLGLIYVSPILERRTKLFYTMPMWREVFISTVATQIVVLPLLLYQTGMLSLVSLPANLLVLPLIPLTMLTGFVSGLAGLLHPSIGLIIGIPSYGLLSWILAVAKYAAQIPFAAVHTGSMSPLIVFALYIGIALLVRYEQSITVFISRTLRARRAPPSS